MTETTDAAPEQQAPASTEQQAAQNGEVDELAGLDDHVRRLLDRANGEAAHYRHRMGEAEQALAEFKRQHESEQERRDREAEERGAARVQADLVKLRDEYERKIGVSSIRVKAADRGFADPDDAVRLLPLDELLAVDERKRDEAVTRALDALLEAKPYLGREQRSQTPLVTPGGRSQAPEGRARERSWLRG